MLFPADPRLTHRYVPHVLRDGHFGAVVAHPDQQASEAALRLVDFCEEIPVPDVSPSRSNIAAQRQSPRQADDHDGAVVGQTHGASRIARNDVEVRSP
jgi:hypothetical protein